MKNKKQVTDLKTYKENLEIEKDQIIKKMCEDLNTQAKSFINILIKDDVIVVKDTDKAKELLSGIVEAAVESLYDYQVEVVKHLTKGMLL